VDMYSVCVCVLVVHNFFQKWKPKLIKNIKIL
jgi:hypothetical protein